MAKATLLQLQILLLLSPQILAPEHLGHAASATDLYPYRHSQCLLDPLVIFKVKPPQTESHSFTHRLWDARLPNHGLQDTHRNSQSDATLATVIPHWQESHYLNCIPKTSMNLQSLVRLQTTPATRMGTTHNETEGESQCQTTCVENTPMNEKLTFKTQISQESQIT